MPIRVHVKGKRKAPPPPIKASEPTTANNETVSPGLSENITDVPISKCNGTDVKPKKKIAPIPPTDSVQPHHELSADTTHINMAPNNLSESSSPGKLLRKKYDSNIFFNIIGASMSSDKCSAKELVQIAANEKGVPILKNFRSNVDNDNENRCADAIAIAEADATTNGIDRAACRNLLVWNCQYCTLENPFWKIVCAVCDNMKPYDLPTSPTTSMAMAATMMPTTSATQTADVLNLGSKACFDGGNNNNMTSSSDGNNKSNPENDKNRMNDVKIDNLAMTKENNMDNAYDEIYSPFENENVVAACALPTVDITQPYAVDVVYRKKVNNKDADSVIKRNSEIIIKDYPTTTLEMEKQRLRAVIRSMNNRALAEQYPVQSRNAVSLNNDVANRKQTPEYASIEDVAGFSGTVSDASKSGAIRKTDLKKNAMHDQSHATNENCASICQISMSDSAPLSSSHSPASSSSLKEKGTKVSTSAQTDTFMKAAPASYATLHGMTGENVHRKLLNDASVANSSAAPDTIKSAASSVTVRSRNSDLPDDCYEYIGNLSMYGDQDIFTNTLKKLENAFSDKKNEGIFVQMNLSNLQLSMNLPKKLPEEKSILVNLYINFNNAIEIEVQPNMLLSQLKDKIAQEMLPSIEQRIYFNGMLMDKEQTLREYGIKEKSSIYLNTEDVKVEVDNAFKNSSVIPYVGDGMKFIKNDLASSPIKTNNYILDYQNRPSTSGTKPANQVTKRNEPSAAAKNEPIDLEQYRKEHIEMNGISKEKPANQVPNPNITKNKYRGVYNYNPRYNPALVIEGEPYLIRIKNDDRSTATNAESESTKVVEAKSQKDATESMTSTATQRQSHYLELLTLDNINDIATNSDAFDCAICFLTIAAVEGVVLRDCLHSFCRDCIRSTIIYSEEAEVRCPHIDASYTCESLLQDREIKALLSKEEHDDHLAKSLRVAENKIQNSFHCRTPNCKGWCIYEDNVNQFLCPICSLINCLTCRVIHDGLNCKQYQENAKNEEGNPDSNTTKLMLEEMVENGEAMFCPTCRVVLMKKWGCDWLKCSMCKTEICWVTRGPRWGPAGKGDTSGGCKCGVGGFKCHPKCNYCH